MNDPTDKELLEFVARFVGWTEIKWDIACGAWGMGPDVVRKNKPTPEYLIDLNAWHRDVWPKIAKQTRTIDLAWAWHKRLAIIVDGMAIDSEAHGPWNANADARSRCLALWRALDGRLTDTGEHQEITVR